ncbi:MAG: CAP domain-containing protein [Patescibacteria group bacterium]|jgi:uncharacterized protein YkwD|nr:CAP domain-containing protein [Patescibacteria group bacterium]
MNKNKNKNLIACLLIVSSFLFGRAFVVSATSFDLIEEGIVKLVNEEREKEGLSSLQENELLNESAKMKAQDILGNDYFAHTSPSGVDPWYWFDEVGYNYKYAGENLAMDFTSASSVHKAWMKSETHKENIMSPKYQEIGVAVMDGIIDNHETRIAVQIFGSRMDGEVIDSEKIMSDDGSSVEIKEVSVTPWQANGKDEMLAFAEIDGEPNKVEAIIGDDYYELEKLREGVYMNLIYFKEEDIKGKKITIKATDKDQKSISREVPNFFLDDYLAIKKEKGEDKEMIALAGIDRSDDGIFGGMFSSQNNIMLVVMGVFILTIFNVWFLEKEEERLLSFKVMEGANSS